MKYKYVPRVNRKYVGSYLPKIDGKEKAMGRTKFFDDITIKAKVPRMLHLAILNAPYANGQILSMDTSKAEALEGVREIIRYDDPDGFDSGLAHYGNFRNVKNYIVLAGRKDDDNDSEGR